MTRYLLCASPRCRDNGKHYDQCEGDCAGCMPRQAADGSRLCIRCGRQLGRDITAAAELYDELAERLLGGGGGGGCGSRPPGPRTPDDAAIGPRREIRATLTTWARVVIEEREVAAPADKVEAIAAFLGRHVDWLAQHEAAGECADDLAELARKARRVAYPSGSRSFVVAPCPADGPGGADGPMCEGQLRAIVRDGDALLPSELRCDVDDAHVWPASSWMRLGKDLGRTLTLTAREAMALYGWSQSAVYRHACLDRWSRTPDGLRPVLYWAIDVERTAARLGAQVSEREEMMAG